MTFALLVLAALAAWAVEPPRPVADSKVLAVVPEGSLSPSASAVLSDGSVVHAWASAPGQIVGQLWVQRFLPNGRFLPPLMVTSGVDLLVPFAEPQLATDGERLALTWRALRPPEPSGVRPFGVFFTLLDDQMQTLAPPTLASGIGPRDRFGHRLAVDADQVIVGFTSITDLPDGADVFARRFDWSGQPIGSSVRIHEETFEDQILGDLAILSGGDVLFVWDDFRGGEASLGDVWGRRLDADLEPLTPSFQISPPEGGLGTRQDGSRIAALRQDAFVVAWNSISGDGEPASSAVLVQPFDSGGAAIGDPFVPYEDPLRDQHDPRLAALEDGGFVVAWTDECLFAPSCFDAGPVAPSRDGSLSGIYGRVFDGLGNPAAPDFHIAPTPVGQQMWVDLAAAPLADEARLALDNRPSVGDGLVASWWTSPLTPGSPPNLQFRQFASPCGPGPRRACVGAQDRFQVSALFQPPGADAPSAGRVRDDGGPLDPDDAWAAFWWFEPGNLDFAVKVLDGEAITGTHWVYGASLSDVAFEVEVFDATSGRRRRYTNPAGTFASFGDVEGLLPAGVVGAPLLTSGSASTKSPASVASPLTPPIPPSCIPSATIFCIADRFEVQVSWTDFLGNGGQGRVIELEDETVGFWFFDPAVPDVIVKVLDGTAINDHYWVYYGSLSNVEFEIRVLDYLRIQEAIYRNDLGEFASAGDVEALDP
ncbi:MAG: hypothetical protein DWQ36_19965 [Acidobacteria bacterium]|nr:MAG: hypothetical protein DWQ30_02960 [Acidobacteriota bacterium]REK03628.1 MAG: hypothetical protein DWQ36_19965 [Acidobacteriota bacterium]